jgi:hypothetical protein
LNRENNNAAYHSEQTIFVAGFGVKMREQTGSGDSSGE